MDHFLCSEESPLEAVNLEGKYLQDELHLLNIFPEEIWRILLDRIDDNNDLLNLTNASPYFRSLLLPRRVEFLFPKMWGILGMKWEDEWDMEAEDSTEESLSSSSSTPSGGVVQDSGPEFWFRRVQKLRLVCREWRDAIDSFYQSLPQFYKMGDDDDPLPFKPYKKEVGYWANLDTLDSWSIDYLRNVMGHFEDSHGGGAEDATRNPFLTRKIRINFEARDEGHVFFALLSTFLIKYGHHFWYCELSSYFKFPSGVAYYSKLREMLLLLPNLKVLNVRRCPPEQATAEDLAQLQSEIDLNPLPNLENLELLRTRSLHPAILNKLLASSGNISMLEISRCPESSEDNDYNIYSTPLPNLKQLSIPIYTGNALSKFVEPEVTWRLEKLYLDFGRCRLIAWSPIFSMLKDKFGESLTNLALVLPKAKGERGEKRILAECPSLKLELPNLKRLKVTLSNYTSLDFILPMRSHLESLKVVVLCDFRGVEAKCKSLTDDVKKGQALQFLDYLGYRDGQGLVSNVWTLCPKLQRLELSNNFTGASWKSHCPSEEWYIDSRSYTRQDWEYWQEWKAWY